MIEANRLRAYLKLHLASGVGAVTFKRVIEAFGQVEQAVSVSRGQMQKVEGVGEKTSAAIAAVTDQQIDDELDEAAKRNVQILAMEDEAYPPALKTIYDPPPVLYVRGRLVKTDALALGIVGSRRCTHYGLEQAERFGQLLGRSGFTVVSGGARGIDTAAHHGALTAGGRTVAVMGCGLSHIYPPENDKLFEKIVESDSGALISELPMKTTVLPGNFPTRNRIISGLSLGVLVVEAARRSGSLHTSREAAEQGREVFAVPGRVDSPLSQGTNELIRGGAILVQNLEDILEHLGAVGQKMTPQEAEISPPQISLKPDEAKVMAVLDQQGLGLDEVVRRSNLPSGTVISSLTMLVLKGAAAQLPGNIFKRKDRRGSSSLFQ